MAGRDNFVYQRLRQYRLGYLCGIAEDVHLGMSLYGFFALPVQFACHGLVQVILAAVLADGGGYVADDDDRVAALQGNGDRAGRRIALFTDDASHVGLFWNRKPIGAKKSVLRRSYATQP